MVLKENRLSAEKKMVGERGLEPPRIATLDPKSSVISEIEIDKRLCRA